MKLGIYQHFKGMKYKVLGLVKHSETLEEMVLYEALYDNKLSKLWVRPKDMFFEEVVVQGKKVPRFTYVGNI